HSSEPRMAAAAVSRLGSEVSQASASASGARPSRSWNRAVASSAASIGGPSAGDGAPDASARPARPHRPTRHRPPTSRAPRGRSRGGGATVHAVEVADRDVRVLAGVIGAERVAHLLGPIADRARDMLGTGRVLNVNSTGAGGGVAELLRVLLAYTRSAQIDGR